MRLKTLNEALKLSVAKQYRRKWNKNYYDELFKKANAKYRIYIPFNYSNLSPKSNANRKNINACLSRINDVIIERGSLEPLYTLVTEEMYLKGYVTKGKQTLKIGRVLKNEYEKINSLLYKAAALRNNKIEKGSDDDATFADENFRSLEPLSVKLEHVMDDFMRDNDRTTATGFFIVISRHPYDIAGMSTNRHWKSCTNLNGGTARNFVINDVIGNSLIAYIVRDTDKNVTDPLSRVLIRPYTNKADPSDVILKANTNVYGTNIPGFIDAVQNYLDEWNNQKEKVNGLYCAAEKIYNDGEPTIMLKVPPTGTISDETTQIAMIELNGLNYIFKLSDLERFRNPSKKVLAKLIREFIRNDSFPGVNFSDLQSGVCRLIMKNEDFLKDIADRLASPDARIDGLVEIEGTQIPFDSIMAVLRRTSLYDDDGIEVAAKILFNLEYIENLIKNKNANSKRIVKYWIVEDYFEKVLSLNERYYLLEVFQESRKNDPILGLGNLQYYNVKTKPKEFNELLVKTLPNVLSNDNIRLTMASSPETIVEVFNDTYNSYKEERKVAINNLLSVFSTLDKKLWSNKSIADAFNKIILNDEEVFEAILINTTKTFAYGLPFNKEGLAHLLLTLSSQTNDNSYKKINATLFLFPLLKNGNDYFTAEECIDTVSEYDAGLILRIFNSSVRSLTRSYPHYEHLVKTVLKKSPKSLVKFTFSPTFFDYMYRPMLETIRDYRGTKYEHSLHYLVPSLFEVVVSARTKEIKRMAEELLESISDNWNDILAHFRANRG